jgi:hypothetical protein
VAPTLPSRLVRAWVYPEGSYLLRQVELSSLGRGRSWVAVEGLGPKPDLDELRLRAHDARIHDCVLEGPDLPPSGAGGEAEPQTVHRSETDPRSVLEAELRLLDRLELPKTPPDTGLVPPREAVAWLEEFQRRRRELQAELDAFDTQQGSPDPAREPSRQWTLWLDVETTGREPRIELGHDGGWATWRPRLTAEWQDWDLLELRLDAQLWHDGPGRWDGVVVRFETVDRRQNPAARPGRARSGGAGTEPVRPPTSSTESVHMLDIASDHPDSEQLLHPDPASAFDGEPLSFEATMRTSTSNTAPWVPLDVRSVPIESSILLRPFASPLGWLVAKVRNLDGLPLPVSALRTIGPDGTCRDGWRHEPPQGNDVEHWVIGPVPEVSCERGMSLHEDGSSVEVSLRLHCEGPIDGVRFEIEDRVPRSVDPQVQVKLIDWEPIDPLFEEEEGRIRFDGVLSAGLSQEFRFGYRLTVPRGHRTILVPGGEP